MWIVAFLEFSRSFKNFRPAIIILRDTELLLSFVAIIDRHKLILDFQSRRVLSCNFFDF